jgi:hypothetical protein
VEGPFLLEEVNGRVDGAKAVVSHKDCKLGSALQIFKHLTS